MTTIEKQQLESFKVAKAIALTIENGLMRRAKLNNEVTNYCGAKVNGRMFVIGDTANDIQTPDAMIMGKPAREVFGDFTIMSR